MKITIKFLKEIQKTPTLIERLSENDIANIIREANNLYYNKNKSLLSDEIYDYIVDTLKNINPENPVLQEIGAPINNKNKKVVLPYWMGSQDKIKTDPKVLERWIHKYPGEYVLTDKLDGISALLNIKNGNYKLYTRGNGESGSDISRMIKYIKNIPKNITEDFAVRGELVISKKNWPKIQHLGSNPRNTVSGVFNSKNPNLEIIQYVDFVTYQILNPSNLIPSEQFNNLENKGFKISPRSIMNNISINILSNYFNDRRNNCEYEIDGIVVINNSLHNINESGNPKYSFAFKNMMTNDSAEVTVLDVQWDISKDGYLIPIVLFPITNIGGVQVQRATGFNAKFIKDNIIGPGSKIVVIRSGDVIPHIIRIIKKSDTGKPKLPDVEFTWTNSGVDIIINNKNSDELQKKILVNFFTKMKTKGVSSGVINKLYNANYKTIYKILNISIDELKSIDGIKIKMANNIFHALKEIDLTDCVAIMVASNTFGRGFGEKKIKLITNVYPNLINNVPTIEQLININGINQTTAIKFINCIDNFKEFLKDNELTCNLNQSVKSNNVKSNKNQNLENIAVLFTGFRDKDMETNIISRGGVIKSTLNKNVNILIIKDIETQNNKISKARDLGITIITRDEFIKLYLF